MVEKWNCILLLDIKCLLFIMQARFSIHKWTLYGKYLKPRIMETKLLPSISRDCMVFCETFPFLSSSLIFIWKAIGHEWLQQVAEASWEGFCLPFIIWPIKVFHKISRIFFFRLLINCKDNACSLCQKMWINEVKEMFLLQTTREVLPNLFKLSIFLLAFSWKEYILVMRITCD